MAQSNLEYGGISLDELDQLGASRKVLPRPSNLPRTREEDDDLLDRAPLPLDTDEIAPGLKAAYLPDRESKSFLTFIGHAREGVAKLEFAQIDPFSAISGFTLKALESTAPQAKGMGKLGHASANRGWTEPVKKPPSPFRSIKRLKKRVRRAIDKDNPFEEIATRPPPKNYPQLQNTQRIVRKIRRKRKKQRSLTRDDIYDPARNARGRMTPEEQRKLREELALVPESSENSDDDVTTTPRESISQRHSRHPQRAPTNGYREGSDSRTTPVLYLPTLVPTTERAPNNPFSKLDISQPTILYLPVPPRVNEEDFVR